MKHKLYIGIAFLLSFGLATGNNDNPKEPSKLEILKKAIKEQNLAQTHLALFAQYFTEQEEQLLRDLANQAVADAGKKIKQGFSKTNINSLVIGGLCAAFSCCLTYELLRSFNPFFKVCSDALIGEKGDLLLKLDLWPAIAKTFVRAVMLGCTGKLAAYYLHKGMSKEQEYKLSQACNILMLLQARSKTKVSEQHAQEQILEVTIN
jgi:hypothetical protein